MLLDILQGFRKLEGRGKREREGGERGRRREDGREGGRERERERGRDSYTGTI